MSEEEKTEQGNAAETIICQDLGMGTFTPEGGEEPEPPTQEAISVEWNPTDVSIPEILAAADSDPLARTLADKIAAYGVTAIGYLGTEYERYTGGTPPFAVHMPLDTTTFDMDRHLLFLREVLEWMNRASQKQPLLQAAEYPIHTGQETDALDRAMSDGKAGRDWQRDAQSARLTHQADKHPHYVTLALTDDDIAGGLDLNDLEDLRKRQDVDAVFAFHYVARLLAPPYPLHHGSYAGGWIDLDDVASKIWPAPRSTKDREANRRKVWDYLRFGARASVCGKRTTTYKDKEGREIPTQIDTPAWAFLSMERPVDRSLWEATEVPLRVELACTRQWTEITTSPKTAQYLPLGEMLGGIPGNKPSGDWARVIGLSLYSLWRREPVKTLGGTIKPTRRELLERYTPKIAVPAEVLDSEHAGRAIGYWKDALQSLVDAGLVAPIGEPSRTREKMRSSLPLRGWQDTWLNETVDIMPGPAIRGYVEKVAQNRAIPLPEAKPQKKRGRPRKTSE